MQKRLISRKERILQAVLDDPILTKQGKYDAKDYRDMNTALYSDNCTVRAVAMIIENMGAGYSETTLYNEIRNYLTVNL